MKKFLYLLPLAATVMLSSCGDDDSSDASPNRTAMLTAKTWKVTGLTLQGQDFYSFLDDCQKDDTYKFNTDHSFVHTDAGEACNQSEAENGTWSFNSNETVITVITPGDTVVANIVSMTATEAKISETQNMNGQQVTAITTFTAL